MGEVVGSSYLLAEANCDKLNMTMSYSDVRYAPWHCAPCHSPQPMVLPNHAAFTQKGTLQPHSGFDQRTDF